MALRLEWPFFVGRGPKVDIMMGFCSVQLIVGLVSPVQPQCIYVTMGLKCCFSGQVQKSDIIMGFHSVQLIVGLGGPILPTQCINMTMDLKWNAMVAEVQK